MGYMSSRGCNKNPTLLAKPAHFASKWSHLKEGACMRVAAVAMTSGSAKYHMLDWVQQDIKMRFCSQCKSHVSTVRIPAVIHRESNRNRLLSEATPKILEGKKLERLPPKQSNWGSSWAFRLVCCGRARLLYQCVVPPWCYLRWCMLTKGNVTLPVCVIPSGSNHPNGQLRVSDKISCWVLAEKMWRISRRGDRLTQLCCSTNK